jgi:hypothetical protein
MCPPSLRPTPSSRTRGAPRLRQCPTWRLVPSARKWARPRSNDCRHAS